MKIKSLIIVAVLFTAILGFGISVNAQSWCHTFNTNLGFANSGSPEVGSLKTALIKNGILPSQAVNNTYNEATVPYIKKFQAKYGILQTGYIGVATRAKLNALYGCRAGSAQSGSSSVVSAPGSSAPGVAPNLTQQNQPISSAPSSTPGLITLFSPNGGEKYVVTGGYNTAIPLSNTNWAPVGYNITWKSSNLPANTLVNIVLINYASGTPVRRNIATVPVSNNFYSWQIPCEISGGCTFPVGNKFKISLEASTGARDESADYFTILPSDYYAKTVALNPITTAGYNSSAPIFSGTKHITFLTSQISKANSQTPNVNIAGIKIVSTSPNLENLKVSEATTTIATPWAFDGNEYTSTLTVGGIVLDSARKPITITADIKNGAPSEAIRVGLVGLIFGDQNFSALNVPTYASFSVTRPRINPTITIKIGERAAGGEIIQASDPTVAPTFTQGVLKYYSIRISNPDNVALGDSFNVYLVKVIDNTSTILKENISMFPIPGPTLLLDTTIPAGTYKLRVVNNLYLSGGVTEAFSGYSKPFKIASNTSLPTCQTFTYSSWSTCVNGQITRTITSRLPQGCVGGTPEFLFQQCSGACVPNWQAGSWGACVNSQQTRTVTDLNNCGLATGKPSLSQSCTVACTPNWQAGSWGTCTNGHQTRTVTDLNNCGLLAGQPATTQPCTVVCTPNWQCGAWTTCTNNQQVRTCTDSNNCGVIAGRPVMTQSCVSPITITPGDKIGLYNPATSNFYLRNTNTTGAADIAFAFGAVNWKPIAGDWTGKGISTIGLYNPTTSQFYLKNTNSTGFADVTFGYGAAGWVPIAGDWDGNGTDTIGLYDPATSQFYLRNSNTQGGADINFGYGAPNWIPIAGDWNNDGTDEVGLYDASTARFFLRNSPTSTTEFGYGAANWIPVVGDWNNDGTDTIGLYNPATSTFYLRNSNTTGAADVTFAFGSRNWAPIAGKWTASVATLNATNQDLVASASAKPIRTASVFAGIWNFFTWLPNLYKK
jgi:hypothetical protein